MLTPEEKWFFDLNGYFVVKNAVAQDEVKAMRDMMYEWRTWDAGKFEPPMRIAHQPGKPWWVYNMQYGHEAFQRLMVNKEILRVITALTWNHPRIVDVVANICDTEADGLELHGGHIGTFRSPYHQYQVANGEIFASFFNMSVSLVDVPPGNGFSCIPGSHKSAFQYPEHIKMIDDPPTVRNIPVNAGDLIIFLPNTRHAGRKWTHQAYPRMTVFLRWAYAKQFHHVNDALWFPFREHKDRVPEAVFDLECRDHGQRKALDALIDEYKVDIPG